MKNTIVEINVKTEIDIKKELKKRSVFSPSMTKQQTTRRRRHDAKVAYCDKIDAKLPESRKIWLYNKCTDEVAHRLCKKGVYPFDAEEIAATMYFDLIDRRVEDVFPRGMPESDAVWMAFLKKESEYAFLAHYRSSWRHPTESLNAPVPYGGADEDGGEADVARIDMLPDKSEDEYRSRPEVMMELGNVRNAVSLICKRRNYKPATCRAVKMAFLEEESVAEIASKCDMTANNVSAIKFRFRDALCEDGPSVMAELERLSA